MFTMQPKDSTGTLDDTTCLLNSPLHSKYEAEVFNFVSNMRYTCKLHELLTRLPSFIFRPPFITSVQTFTLSHCYSLSYSKYPEDISKRISWSFPSTILFPYVI